MAELSKKMNNNNLNNGPEDSETKKQNTYKKFKRNQIITNLLPFAGLIVIFIAYTIVCFINDYSYVDYLWATFDRGVYVALMAIGASFLFTLGQFDLSLGSAMGISAACGLLVYMSTGNIVLSAVVCVFAAMIVSLANILFSSVLRVPIFIMSIAMMTVLQKIILALIDAFGGDNASQINLTPNPFYGTFIQTEQFRLLILILYFVVCVFVFRYLKFGRKAKFLGGNPWCARLTGISPRRNSIVAFLICAVGVGLTALCFIGNNPTVTTSTGSTYGMDIMVAIVIGGMPMSGGARSKISASLCGAFTLAFLEEFLRAFPETSGEGTIQIVKAVLFVLLVFVSSWSYRTKTLPR
ncbi:MAG: ABC transporter permease [Bacilli bacterium]